jgi:glycosyltransferase involved in cell wall biosynthesis
LALGYPIEIYESPTFVELKAAYGKAKLFWSAVGFGVDEAREPKKVEHFGITVVEAMAAGAIPIVYSAGGYKEIVEQGENGFLWSTKGQLLKYTKLLTQDKALAKKISVGASKNARKFGYDKFEKKFLELL